MLHRAGLPTQRVGVLSFGQVGALALSLMYYGMLDVSGRFGIVKPVEPEDPNVKEVVADWKRTPDTVGIRLRVQKGSGIQHDDPGVDRIARAAVKYDFPVNFLCWGNIDTCTKVIDRHPDTRFVLDHLGILQPRTPALRAATPWADLPKVVELAKRKNVVIKVSGACTL